MLLAESTLEAMRTQGALKILTGALSLAGINACIFQKLPQSIQRLFPIPIKRAAADPPEFPAGSAQLGLAALVILPFFFARPPVSVALDGDAAVFPLHYQIDPVLIVSRERAKLRDDGVASVDDLFSDIKLELAVRALLEYGETGFDFSLGRIKVPTQKLMPHALGVIDVYQPDRVEEENLITGAARGDVESSPRVFSDLRREGSVGGDNHRKEHDVPFVALKSVGVAADDSALFSFPLVQLRMARDEGRDIFRLFFAEQRDDPNRPLPLAVSDERVARIVTHVDQRFDESLSLRLIDVVVVLEAVLDVDRLNRRVEYLLRRRAAKRFEPAAVTR